jgi:putative endopeptidase
MIRRENRREKPMSKTYLLLTACALVWLAACADPAAKPGDAGHGLDLAGMDKSVAPGDDFYAYTNGTWMKTTQIPADRSSYGNFAKLLEVANQRTQGLIQDAANNAADGSEAQKIGDYYASFMDEAGIEGKGLAPLKPELDAIAGIADKTALSSALGSTLRSDVDALNNTNFYTDRLFGLWVSPDFNNPDVNAPYLLQGGLGMPDRDYYLKTDAKMVELQGKYKAHIAAVLKLAGAADADAKAGRIYDLEKKIAQSHTDRADSEDVHKANNPWAEKDFAAKAPGLDWAAYFKAAGLDSAPMVMVWQPHAIQGLAALVGSQPLDVWKDYLTFHAIDRNLSDLPKAFADEDFAFHGRAMSGALEQPARWKRGVAATNAALGDAVGKLYVAKYFPPEAKAKAQAMVGNIMTVFSARIDRLDWMSAATKAKAKEKLKTLYIGVGYPDKWQDYSGLKIVRGDALGNAERASLFAYHQDVALIGKPVDKTKWRMTPQTVNAVNLPLQNALNFPAAILQAPFYDPDAEGVLNYGGIGAIIGHEISHSFDDQGSQFDASGRLTNWWTPQDFAHFRASADRLAQEYNAYEPLPGMHVNGKLTLSENIADVAGISASFDGYHASLAGKTDPVIDGFTGDQRFFLRFGQIWRNKAREAAVRRGLLTDGHAPAQYRADTVRNLDAWYTAFPVKAGQKLYLAPKDRVRIW